MAPMLPSSPSSPLPSSPPLVDGPDFAAADAGEITPAEARLAMMELANMISMPMALTDVIRLDVPAAIWAGGANAPVAAADLLPLSHADPFLLERLLCHLASYGVFSEHRMSPRRFLLCHLASYADSVLQHHQDALVRAWPRLDEAVLDQQARREGVRTLVNVGGSSGAYLEMIMNERELGGVGEGLRKSSPALLPAVHEHCKAEDRQQGDDSR